MTAQPSQHGTVPPPRDHRPEPGRRPGTDGPPPGPAGRRVAAAAGLVVVAVLGAGGGWLLGHGGNTGTAAGPTTPTGPTSPAASASGPSATTSRGTAPTALADVTQIDPKSALAEFRKAGLHTVGDPVEGWSWTDANGRNVFLTTKTVEKREGKVIRAATLHVYQAAHLGQAPDMLISPLRDPGTPNCDVDFGLDFVPGSVKVTDADGDGYAEASVGWWSICRGDPGAERIKLALLTKGTYFILRGYGLRAGETLPPGITVKPATFQPNVPAAKWPKGTYDGTVALFRQLFR